MLRFLKYSWDRYLDVEVACSVESHLRTFSGLEVSKGELDAVLRALLHALDATAAQVGEDLKQVVLGQRLGQVPDEKNANLKEFNYNPYLTPITIGQDCYELTVTRERRIKMLLFINLITLMTICIL